MRIELIYGTAVIFSLYLTFSFIYDGFFSKGVLRQRKSLARAMRELMDNFSDKTNDEVFTKIGFGLSVKRYSAYRNLIALIVLAWSMFKLVVGQYQDSLKLTILLIILLFLTVPKNEIIKGRKSPFKATVDFFYKKRKEKLDNELINIIGQMRNMILSSGSAISADYIFTRLIPYTHISKPIFIQTHSFLQKGRKKDGAAYFKGAYDTWLGGEFSQLLGKLDTLPPYEFLQQIEVLQSSIADLQDTEADKKRERQKTIIFTLAMVQGSLIVFDFLYIVIKDAVDSLSTL